MTLYALKYENDKRSAYTRLIDLLYDKGIDRDKIQIIKEVLRYGGANLHNPELFGTKGISSFVKKLTAGLKDIPNIFTQHKPLITQLIDNAVRGKLKEQTYPSATGLSTTPSSAASASAQTPVPKDIIVFFIGGCTFEEALAVRNYNKDNAFNARIVLGGTSIINPQTFLSEIEKIGEDPESTGVQMSTTSNSRIDDDDLL